MALRWPTSAILPLPIGGAGRVYADPGDPVQDVVVLVGAEAAQSHDDPACLRCEMASGTRWEGVFFGAVRGPAVVSFFARLLDGTWEAGPAIEVPLSFGYQARILWVKDWILDRLREIAEDDPPALDRPLCVTGAFPRPTTPMPALSVQVTSNSQASVVVGNLASRGRLVGSSDIRVRQYSVSVAIDSWALTPEDRDEIARWLLRAMEMVMDAMRATGIEEPSVSTEESELPEEASPLRVQLFLSTGRITATVWSKLTSPVQSMFGRLAV